VEVPHASTKPQVSDDDEFKFLDDTPRKTTKPQPSVLENLDLSDFDLKEMSPVKEKDDFAKAELDAIAAALKSTESTDDEFRFSCKICGTAMYAKASEVGNMVRCPDCYAQFSIPRPAPKPQVKKTSLPKATEDIPLKSSPSKSAYEIEERNAASDYLRRAEEDLQKDAKEKKSETYDFDSLGAFDKAFGYMSDPSVWILSIIPGLFLGVAVIAAQYVIARAALDPQYRQAGIVGAVAIMAIFGLPILGGCLANGLAILEQAANKVRRITQWPFYNMGEAMGDILMLLVILLLSSVPGGILGWLAVSVAGLHSILATVLPLVSIWFFFPIMLLSVLDNGAIAQPFSAEVVGSMKERLDSWGAMYLWNSLALSLLAVVAFYTIGHGTFPTIIGTAFIPVVLYFVFRQIGNLAAEISDLTNLHFDSDEEEDEEDDSLVKEVNRKTSKTEMY
jgi:hypothetical protein